MPDDPIFDKDHCQLLQCTHALLKTPYEKFMTPLTLPNRCLRTHFPAEDTVLRPLGGNIVNRRLAEHAAALKSFGKRPAIPSGA